MASISSTVVLGRNGSTHVVEGHIENTLGPAVQVSSSMSTPDLALKHIRERDDELRRVLAEAGYQGKYAVQAGYDMEMLRQSGVMLQEIIVTIQDKSIPRALIPELADIFFPFPGSLRTGDGDGVCHAIPVMPPQDNSMGEAEYWERVTSSGVCTGYYGSTGLPTGRPAFIKHGEFGLHEEDAGEKKRVWWKLWKRS